MLGAVFYLDIFLPKHLDLRESTSLGIKEVERQGKAGMTAERR